jgi:predicted porin
MKKSLFAIAAVTAFAGAAQAQSSVTVYGILDMGLGGGNYNNNNTSKSTAFSVQQAGQATSRLGFRGNEDLGGGTAAFFTFETGLLPNSQANSTGTLSTFNTRQAFIGLSQKGIGRVSIGTQQTTIHDVVSRTTAGANNNLVGDLMYTVNGNAGGATLGSNTAFGMAGGQSYTVRANNMVKFATENLSGFQANAMFILNGVNATQPAASANATSGTLGGGVNNTGWGLGLNYTFKKLFLTANYQALTNETTMATVGSGTVAPTPFAIFGASQNPTMGANVRDNQMYIAGTYDFGVLQAFAGYINRKVTADNTSTYFQRYTAQQIGVRSNLTKTVNVFASASTGAWEETGYDLPSAKINGYQLGANYVMSKRTNLYAIFGNASQSVAANSSTAVSNSANTSYNMNNYAVGVRHTF